MLKRFLKYIKLCNALLQDLHKREGISMLFLWIDSMWALFRHGCLIKQYTFGGAYKIPNCKMSDVMTQRRLDYIIKHYNNSQKIHLLKNKNEFNYYFKEWIHRRWLWSRNMSESLFIDLISGNKCLFIKPLNDQEGHGIYVLNNVSTKEYGAYYSKLKNDNVMIEEAIVQHPSMSFNNSAVNTVRVITCLDTHFQPHILRAALRVGIGKSIVDNYSAGGALYDVDVVSGRIDNKGIGHDNKTYIFHPMTNICMLGYQVPNWDMVVECVSNAARLIPQCRFIGWDVAITEFGVELIEGNHNPGLFSLESVGKPYAFSEAIRYFNL